MIQYHACMADGSDPKQVRVLEYSAPPLFFAGSYRYRTAWTLVGSIMALVFAGGLAVAAVVAFRESKTTPAAAVAAIVCGVASALTFAAASWTIYQWRTRAEITLRVTQEGVEYWGRLWAWPHIERIGGYRAARGVYLMIKPAGAFHAPRSLLTTRPLTRQQFASLMQSLQAYLPSRYPNVTIETEPRENED